jgi:hypothetical protein
MAQFNQLTTNTTNETSDFAKEPKVMTLPKVMSLLNEIDEFYIAYYGKFCLTSCCKFIEGACNHRSSSDTSRTQNWELMKSYAARANISVKEAQGFEYLYYCHCCGQDLEFAEMKGRTYCSDECETAIESDGYKCHFNECLMCQDEKVNTPPFLERIKKFYYLSELNETYHGKWGGFGVSDFRKLEKIAESENLTLQKSLYFQRFGKRPLNLKEEGEEEEEEEQANCIDKLFVDDKADLAQYAHDYGVTMLQAYRQRHYCYTCNKDVVPHSFGPGHQFCSARCEVNFEEKSCLYSCPRCYNGQKINCKLCDGELFYLNQKIIKREKELSIREPVLATIHVFKELLVYNEIFGCLPDLVDYY